MTRGEYLDKLANELHYDADRMRVVVEHLSAKPDMSENDFDDAWASSKLAWQLWCILMENFERSPDSKAEQLTLHQLSVCYRLLHGMLTMFGTALRLAVGPNRLPSTTEQRQIQQLVAKHLENDG